MAALSTDTYGKDPGQPEDQPFYGPAWARNTTCCGKPIGCTNMSAQCLMRNHPWKQENAQPHGRLGTMTAEQIAQAFHETYERLAPDFGYKTREASAKPWADVPEQNKALMVAVVQALLDAGVILGVASQQRSDEDRIRGAMAEAHKHPGRVVITCTQHGAVNCPCLSAPAGASAQHPGRTITR